MCAPFAPYPGALGRADLISCHPAAFGVLDPGARAAFRSAGAVITFCQPVESLRFNTRTQTSMNTDEKRALIDRYVAAYNSFDVDGMLAVLNPDVEFQNVSGGEINASASGAEEFRRMAEQSQGLFASRHQEITRFRSEGDTAAVDIRYEGVLASDLPNGMRAGETLRLEGRSEFSFRDGRIDRIADYS